MRLIDGDELHKQIEKIGANTIGKERILLDTMLTAVEYAPEHKGRWIYVGAHNGVHLFECSLCHCGLNTENPDWLSKYCSGCGAKMDEKPGGDKVDEKKEQKE